MFLKIFRNISCVRAARNNVATFCNIVGHNVAATMCPRFAGAVDSLVVVTFRAARVTTVFLKTTPTQKLTTTKAVSVPGFRPFASPSEK